MALVHHPDVELMGATDWEIDGTLLNADGNALDLSNATLQWTLIGPDGLPALADGDATITVVDAAARTVTIAVHHAVTARLECGRYMDALHVTIGDVVSPLWVGQILVAANPRRGVLA